MILFQNFQNLFLPFLFSFFFTVILTPILIKIAFKLNVLDKPDGKLKKHENVTPYLGGVSIFLGLITSLILFYNLNNFSNNYIYLFPGLFFLLLVGLIDDIFVIKPIHKIFGQSIVAIIFIISGLILNFSNIYFINLVLSLFWFLSIMNSFNLVDVMDGLATTLAFCCSFSFMLFSIILGKIDLAILFSSFCGSLIGFFLFNKPRAKIYLGDAGSLFIGGFFSVLPILLFNLERDFNNINLLIVILILFIPFLELISLIILRSYKKIPFYLGSPDHFSIYLQKKGWNKNYILFYVFLLNLILLIASLSIYFNNIYLLLIPFIIIFLAFWSVVLYK